MDTRFWGPSGWKLLHLVAADYSAENAADYAAFFETIPYILPCKFCRASLTDYYREYPFPSLESNIEKWMYTIHNCVNDKLRSQGLYASSNPPYTKVKALYRKLRQCPWKQQMQYVWDFLFSVGYHHPTEKRLYASPMPECPPQAYVCKDTCERNKWNVLPMKDRMEWFKRFWSILPAVLPSVIASHWKRAEKEHPPTWSTRESTVTWLWKMRCALDANYNDPYTVVCKQISTHASDCSTQRGVFTCRRRRRSSTLKRKRVNKTTKKQ